MAMHIGASSRCCSVRLSGAAHSQSRHRSSSALGGSRGSRLQSEPRLSGAGPMPAKRLLDTRLQASAPEVEEKQPSATNMNMVGNGGDDVDIIDKNDPRTSIFSASSVGSVVIDTEVEGRPLSEYMALPASQYSVLDAKRIERIDDDSFKCYIGGISILGFKVDPVITVSVTPGERGCVVRLLSCKLEGNRLVEAVNSQFNASMTNQLEWRLAEDGSNNKEIISNLNLEVVLTVPGWFIIASPSSVSATGSKVMQQVVNQVVPRFLAQLQKDYLLWASGDDSRKPLGEGMIGVDENLADESK